LRNSSARQRTEIGSHGGIHCDRNCGFQRTRLGARRRGKHHEFAGLPATTSGIEAAIAASRRSGFLCSPAPIETHASALMAGQRLAMIGKTGLHFRKKMAACRVK
jgi:hypothetical protein